MRKGCRALGWSLELRRAWRGRQAITWFGLTSCDGLWLLTVLLWWGRGLDVCSDAVGRLSCLYLRGWAGDKNLHTIPQVSNIMANNPSIPPPVISIPRIRTLVVSLLVSLGSGTGYVSNSFLITLNIDLIKNFSSGLLRWGLYRRPFSSKLPSPQANVGENGLLILSVAYSPQLGKRLKISHTQLNIVALAASGAEFIRLEHFSSLPDTPQSGVPFLVRYGDDWWILVGVLAYSLPVVLYSF